MSPPPPWRDFNITVFLLSWNAQEARLTYPNAVSGDHIKVTNYVYWCVYYGTQITVVLGNLQTNISRTRMGEGRTTFKILKGAPTESRPLGRPRRRWEDDIRMDLNDIGINTRNWVDLAQDEIIVKPLWMWLWTFGFHKLWCCIVFYWRDGHCCLMLPRI